MGQTGSSKHFSDWTHKRLHPRFFCTTSRFFQNLKADIWDICKDQEKTVNFTITEAIQNNIEYWSSISNNPPPTQSCLSRNFLLNHSRASRGRRQMILFCILLRSSEGSKYFAVIRMPVDCQVQALRGGDGSQSIEAGTNQQFRTIQNSTIFSYSHGFPCATKKQSIVPIVVPVCLVLFSSFHVILQLWTAAGGAPKREQLVSTCCVFVSLHTVYLFFCLFWHVLILDLSRFNGLFCFEMFDTQDDLFFLNVFLLCVNCECDFFWLEHARPIKRAAVRYHIQTHRKKYLKYMDP